MPSDRFQYVEAPKLYLLDRAVVQVHEAFGEHCYQVGSSMERATFRDVDVRMVVSDARFEQLFPGETGSWHNSPMWALLCASISALLSRQTGLPIDFQVQARSAVTAEDWEKPRSALGMIGALR